MHEHPAVSGTLHGTVNSTAETLRTAEDAGFSAIFSERSGPQRFSGLPLRNPTGSRLCKTGILR
jgi:hypothetical protein